MEILKINKNELQAHFGKCRELKEVIDKLELNAQNSGKVVCSIRVNGLKLTESDEFRFASTDLKDIEEIEVQLSLKESVIINSVRALREFLLAFKNRVLAAAEHYRENANAPEQHIFSEIVQSTHLLADALLATKLSLIGRAPDEKKYHEMWGQAESHFMITVRELATAYEKQDFVLVSDVLEYELLNSIDKWLELVSIDS